MENSKIIADYEKEYANEIASVFITIEDLEKCGVSEKTLASELYLRNFYGDEIVKQKLVDDVDDKRQKTVVKIDEAEKDIDNELRQIWNDIESSEFDKNIDTILQ